jgi:energy-coupling factor transport system ATP-binding protein
VAIGAVLAAHPRILVLDEPTSALDPQAAEDVLAALHRLVHDLGTTVLLAEHRLERVVQYADHVLYLPGDGRVVEGAPADVMGIAAVVPPVVELGKLARWSPLPLSIRDARRAAAGLRERLTGVEPGARAPGVVVPGPESPPAGGTRPAGTPLGDTRPGTTPLANTSGIGGVGIGATGGRRRRWFGLFRSPPARAAAWPAATAENGSAAGVGEPRCQVSGLAVRYGETVALRGVDLEIRGGEVVAVMGRNGAGKSSLLSAMVGLIEPTAGTVRVGGADPRAAEPAAAIRMAGMVPQDPTDLLYADSVGA